MLRSTFVALAAAGIALSTAAGAQTTQTFSFESPSANYYTYAPTGFAGVTFNGPAGVAVQNSPFFGVTPPDGTQAAFIQSSGYMGIGSISFALTGLSAGTSYTTNFFAATRPDYGYSATTSGSTTPLVVSFNGIELGTYTATSVNFNQFTVPNFLATASTGTLLFSGIPGFYDATTNLDLVTVTSVPGITPVTPTVSGAVPEPATWAMMVGGFGAMGFAMRRRREVGTTVRFT